MASLFALTYLSREARDLLPVELDAILLQARLFNAAEQVTGVLLHGDGRFFQLLEGPQASVRTVFDRISSAQAHTGVHILSQGPSAERFFGSWHMGFANAPMSAMQELSQSAWQDAIPYTRADAEKSPGMGLVMHFWKTWCKDING